MTGGADLRARRFARGFWPCLGLAGGAIVVDQAVKRAVIGASGGRWWRVEVIPDVFNLVMTWNRGVGFGLFSRAGWGPWPFLAVAVVFTCGLLAWMAREEAPLPRIALALMIGGAGGNAIDRVVWGKVADYLDVILFGWRFWTFNLADAWISIGAALLAVDALFRRDG